MKRILLSLLIVLFFFGCKEHTELQNVIEESTVSYDGVMLQNTLDVVRCLSRDDLMALKQLDRDWIFDIIENSTVTYVDDDGRVRDTAVDGCKIYRPSSYLMLSVTKREYYTYPNIQ